ncbi:MAG: hypothetical protein PV340_01945 [Wolbachia sp.]|nr:hypothetical protein [Wolbachia sp.]MDD9336391.1 hypothetical protein [Wolbachia sp.]
MSEENKITDNYTNDLYANEVRIWLTALSLVDYTSNGKIATAGKNVLDRVKSISRKLLEKIDWSDKWLIHKENENKGHKLDGASMKCTENSMQEKEG